MCAFACIAAENPITVRSLSTEEPFRSPVIDDPAPIERQYELQLLQQEVAELRGLVEELTHRVNQLKSRQADRYLELDRRLEDLRQGRRHAEISGTRQTDDTKTPPNRDDGILPAPDNSPAAVIESEKQNYDAALELIRGRQYDEAVIQLERIISHYPDGNYAPNAYYWLGEVYAAKPEPDYEKARQALAQVISFFPNNRKVPDAAFKLGKVYHLMGDCARATEILTQVVQQNKGKTVARLADAYLRDKVSCTP